MHLRSLLRTATIALFAAAMGFAGAPNAADALTLNFGVHSANKPSAMVKAFRPAILALERSMSHELQRDVDIQMQIAKDYDQGIRDLVEGTVDFSNIGPVSYIHAKQLDKDIGIIAVERLRDSNRANGIIAVHADSATQSLEQLRGKSFAFGDEESTTGRYMAQLELIKADILADDLSNYDYLGRYDKVGTAVAAGAFDAGALNEATFRRLKQAGQPLRELARFHSASTPWVASSGLSEQVVTALRTSLLSISNTDVLAMMHIDGFMDGRDADYNPIRAAMQNNDAFYEQRINHVVEDTTTTQTIKHTEPMQAPETSVKSVAPKPIGAIINTSTPIIQTANVQINNDSDSVDNRLITVDITLPAQLFSRGVYHGPRSLTIHLDIPDSAP